ncbi:MAG: amino acid ABC transporter permease [Chloroflexota bacterium]
MEFFEFAQGALPLLFQGITMTVRLTVVSILLGMALGLVVALGRIAKNPLIRAPATFYVEFIRGTPLLVQIFMIYFGIGYWINVSDYVAGIAALSINSAAYNAEIFRAGIQSISRGQMEAARSLGMTYTQSMRYVVLPQAFRVVLPPLGNEFIALLKDSSLVSIIGIADLMRVGREIGGRTLKSFEIFTIVAFLYLTLTVPLTAIVRYAERRFKTT